MKQLKQTSTVRWIPCLLLEGAPLLDGMTVGYQERLPGFYDTPAQAVAAAETAIQQHPGAIGVSAKRVEVCQ